MGGGGGDDRRRIGSPDDRPASVPVHLQDRVVSELMIPIAAPRPILGPLDEASRQRVLVAAVELLEQLVAGAR